MSTIASPQSQLTLDNDFWDDDISLRLLGRRILNLSCWAAKIPAYAILSTVAPFVLPPWHWGLLAMGVACGLLFGSRAIQRGSKVAVTALNVVVIGVVVALCWNLGAINHWLSEDSKKAVTDGWLFIPVGMLPLLVTLPAQLVVFKVVQRAPVKAAKPRRVSRSTKKHFWGRLSYSGLIALLLGLGILVLLIATGVGLALGYNIGMRVGYFVLAAPFFFLAGRSYFKLKRMNAVTAAEARSADQRPPVILLRSFSDDCTMIHSRFRWSSLVLRGRTRTFEEVLTDMVGYYGPVIAIGRPGEPLPPAGAAREYVAHDAWKDRVKSYLAEAVMVVVVLGRSEGVAWEYARLVEQGCLGKTLLVMPPGEAHAQERWNIFVTATKLSLQPPLLPKCVNELRVAAFHKGSEDTTCRLGYVRCLWEDELAYDEVFRSPVVTPILPHAAGVPA